MVEQFNHAAELRGAGAVARHGAGLHGHLLGRAEAHVRDHAADEPLEVICGA